MVICKCFHFDADSTQRAQFLFKHKPTNIWDVLHVRIFYFRHALLWFIDFSSTGACFLVWNQSRGGTHMLRHTGMCRPNGLLFHQKSLDMGPTLVKKILRGGSHFSKFAKNCKISRFWGRKTLRNGSRFAKISKKLSIYPFFEWKKSLDMGRGFRPRAAHSVKK